MSTLCKRAIPHTVKVAKSLEADVLEDGGGRLCGEGNKFSEDIMDFVLGIQTWDSSTLGSSAVTVAKSWKGDVLEDDHLMAVNYQKLIQRGIKRILLLI